jgi:hypothetical protein
VKRAYRRSRFSAQAQRRHFYGNVYVHYHGPLASSLEPYVRVARDPLGAMPCPRTSQNWTSVPRGPIRRVARFSDNDGFGVARPALQEFEVTCIGFRRGPPISGYPHNRPVI